MKDEFYKLDTLYNSSIQLGKYIIKFIYDRIEIYRIDNTILIDGELYARVHNIEIAEYDPLFGHYIPRKDFCVKMLDNTYDSGRIYYKIWDETKVKSHFPEFFI